MAKSTEIQFGFRIAIAILIWIKIIAQQAQIKSLPITDIKNLAEALLDFKGIDDLEIWLQENVV